MSNKICEFCGKEIDSRGYTQHVRKCRETNTNQIEPKQETIQENIQETHKEIVKEVPETVKEIVEQVTNTVKNDTDTESDNDEIEYESNTSGSWMYGLAILPFIVVIGALAYLFGVGKNE